MVSRKRKRPEPPKPREGEPVQWTAAFAVGGPYDGHWIRVWKSCRERGVLQINDQGWKGRYVLGPSTTEVGHEDYVWETAA